MIVVFGSLNLDLIVPVTELPRPGETVSAPSHIQRPGGKGGNQAVAAARAGASVSIAGCVGQDQHTTPILESLAEAGIQMSHVRHVREPTGLALIAVDRNGENQIVVASGANQATRSCHVPDELLVGCSTLLLQLEVRGAESFKLARRAREHGKRVILNAAPAGPVELDCVDWLIVNEGEAYKIAEESGFSNREPVNLARDLARNHGLAVIVTLGGKGAVSCVDGVCWRTGALRVDVIDTVGAGDAFVGVFAASLDTGRSFADAMRLASSAGALACTMEGAMPAMPEAWIIERSVNQVEHTRIS